MEAPEILTGAGDCTRFIVHRDHVVDATAREAASTPVPVPTSNANVSEGNAAVATRSTYSLRVGKNVP